MIPPVGALIFFGMAAILTVVVAGLILEGILIKDDRALITTYVRASVLRNPGRTVPAGILFVFATGLLTAHFIWDAGCG